MLTNGEELFCLIFLSILNKSFICLIRAGFTSQMKQTTNDIPIDEVKIDFDKDIHEKK